MQERMASETHRDTAMQREPLPFADPDSIRVDCDVKGDIGPC